LAKLAKGSLKQKESELRRALQGRLTMAQRFVLRELLARVDELDAAIARVNEEIKREVEENQNPYLAEAIELLQSIPGVGLRVAEIIVSEIGVDMRSFPSDKHLSTWAGMCPGNNESGGKRKSGKSTKGNVYLRTALVQAAWAATHTKDTYLSAQYRRLVKHKGKQRALVAVGHSILVIIYHVLSNRVSYQELGADYFDNQNIERKRKLFIRKLELLGLKVTVEELPLAA
jgi:transposase